MGGGGDESEPKNIFSGLSGKLIVPQNCFSMRTQSVVRRKKNSPVSQESKTTFNKERKITQILDLKKSLF